MEPPAKRLKTPPAVPKTRTCAECHQVKEIQSFSKNQRKKGADAKCKDCTTQAQTPKECSDCNRLKSRGAYEQDQWMLAEGAICKECVEHPKKECSDCKRSRSRFEYSKSQYNLQQDAVCEECRKAALEKKKVQERERRERLAKEPRQCVLCNEKKAKEAFSNHQWGPYIESEMTHRKCLECFPKEQEDEIRRLEQLERERQEKEEFEKQSISKALELKSESNCVCYKFPSHPDSELPFCESPPSDLCGEYDVVFQHSFFDEGSEERTTRGKLVLKKQDGLLHGRVDIDEDVPNGPGIHFNTNFIFDETPTPTPQHSNRNWSTKFVVTPLDPDVEDAFKEGDEVIPATLKVLDKRFGLPWLMDEEDFDLSDMCAPFKFDTLEEAEFIAKKANDHSDSWLCNHMQMDGYVAKHIHEFVCWRPDPVLFLEPGDLVLKVDWCEDYREGAGSWLVARKSKVK